MGHNDHFDGPGIDLHCDSCGELDLAASLMNCARCLDDKAVCFQCIPRDDQRRVDPDEWPRFCAMCQEEMDDE